MGTSLPTGAPPGRPSCSTKWVSWRMRSVSGRPRRRALDTFDDLLTEFVVFQRARGLGREREDRLAMGRALLQADALRDGRLEDSAAEDLGDRLLYVPRQRRAFVVERDQRAQKLQLGVRARPDLLDGLEQ